MRYLGGKGKIGRFLVEAMLDDARLTSRAHALELCAGGGNMTYRLADQFERVTAIEAHPGLVALHQSAKRLGTANGGNARRV